jgi:X-Pro dipeptidyl-peptidase
MNRRRTVTVAIALCLCAAGLIVPRTVAHAATAAPIPANACQTGSDAQCRDYIVTTTFLDPSNQPVNLFLEVEHATDAQGNIISAPLILTYSPYSVLGRNGDAAHWNALGYSRAYADVVGTGNSGGCWDYGGPAEKQTAYDLIEAIAAQPWSNGKIGMLGGSYDGTTQYAAAVMHPPHLTAIVPEAAIDRWYDYAFAGGIRYLDTDEDFGYEGAGTAGDEGVDTPLAFSFGLAVPPPADNTDPMWAQRVQSHFNVCQQVQQTLQGYNFQTPDYTQFWLDRDYLKDLPSVTIPVLVATNFGDWNVKQVDGWQAYHALTGSVFPRVYFGSRWHGHGTPPNTATACTTYSATVDLWFAHWLQGANNGLEQNLPPVTSATTDSAGPTHDSYSCGPEPLPSNIPLYLANASDGTWALSPDAVNAPAGSPSASFLWTGTNAETDNTLHPFANVPNGGGGFLSFASPVLTRDIRLFGEPTLHLWSTVQRTWVTYTPFLIDFDPSKYTGSGPTTSSTTANAIPAMTRGWLDSRYANGLAGPAATQLITPAQPFAEDIHLWPQDYTVRAGHRLILVVTTETTEWDIPKVYDGAPGLPTVQLGYEQSQSYITLPLMGVTNADSIFTGPGAQIPEAPTAPLLVVLPGVAGAAMLIRRRLRSRSLAS